MLRTLIKNRKELSGRRDAPRGAPPVVASRIGNPWFEIQGAAVVERHRYFVLTCFLSILVFLLGCVIWRMVPLKTVVPFILEKTPGGAVQVSTLRVRRFEPDEAEKRYFIAHWCQNIMVINASVTEATLLDAYRLTRGKAIVEFADWIKKTTPLKNLKDTPTLTRSVEISGVSLLESNVALVRLVTETRDLNHPSAQHSPYLVTVNFSIVPPITEAEVFENPAGLFITHFQVSEDLEQHP